MYDSETVQLATLWFVVMTFVQTGSTNADSGLLTAVSLLALLLVWVLPAVILGRLALNVLAD
jgi:hypothetical protein